MRKPLVYIAVSAVILAGVGADLYVRSLNPRARMRVIRELQERFDADVTLQDLKLTLLPQPSVTGKSLLIRHRGWNDAHPLIAIASFTARTGFWNLLFQRDLVESVRLEGLQIHLPPRANRPASKQHDKTRLRITIQNMIADGALLEIEPKTPDKPPLRFDIRKLTLTSLGPSQPLSFRASLTNAKPPGLIDSAGTFGPWEKEDPRDTPVTGHYTFQHADLGVFKGIRGTLWSEGVYGGVLQRIEITGKTDTPDFALKKSGTPVHLTTTFHSIVDGTNGDTILDPVDARFLNSEFICKGGIVKQKGDQGKTIDLQAFTKQARIEDILQLVVADKTPVMTGEVDFRSKIVIPPGHEEVLEKLQLNGEFAILKALFTSPKVEERLRTLSDRARGISKQDEEKAGHPAQTVASDLLGKFTLRRGAASFSHLSFQVPGAQVKVTGGYNLRSRQISMDGLFRMQSTLSGTQSGMKALLLKPLDPLFKKDGAGFQLPFKVTGTREHPSIAVTVFRHTFTVK